MEWNEWEFLVPIKRLEWDGMECLVRSNCTGCEEVIFSSDFDFVTFSVYR